MIRIGLFSLSLFLITGLFAQNRPLGTWNIFMPYGSSLGVYDAGDRVYSVSTKSLFSYVKETGEIQTYDKVIGLSDLDIKLANYDPGTKILVVAYINSSIDLIYDGRDIYNIPDIKDKATTGVININGISFFEGNAYISNDLGVSVINLEKKEISNTYVIGSNGSSTKVYQTTINNGQIFAATDEGVKHASIYSANLQNFNSWGLFNFNQNIPVGKTTQIGSVGSRVYAVNSKSGVATDSLFVYDGQVWNLAYTVADDTFISVNNTSNNLYFTTWSLSNGLGKLGKIDALGVIDTQNTLGNIKPTAWFQNGQVIWEGDLWNGLIKQVGLSSENIVPQGPFRSNVFRIGVADNVVYVAPGGVDESWLYTFNGDGLYYLKNGNWYARNQYTDPPLVDYMDLMCVANDPFKEKTYYGSYVAGLVELDNKTGSLTYYGKDNSILEDDLGDPGRVKIPDLAEDAQGNLWISNGGATKPIKVIGSDGVWRGYYVPYQFQVIKKIMIDSYGQLWCPLRRSGEGILVWSSGGTLDDLTDDKYRLLAAGAGQGGLSDPSVLSLVEDKDNNVWIGTNQGINVFYCAGSVLSGGCDADQIKVERDGYVGYLFGTEAVRALALDAANRKWVGTNNGVWLISSDGKDELLHFTTENSPLPANQITDITVNDNTGEVFIGTLGGLVSYQGDAMGECSDCDKALVYPNPVKSEYEGPIAIKGLTENAYVKITDVSGTLVYQGRANGSQMIWDGKAYNGNKAQSGVYLVFSSTDLGKEKRVAKIVLLN